MVVQRLTIRAATGKLRVIPVWQCLAHSGVKVVRWKVYADPSTGMESMTVDIIEADPLRTVAIAGSTRQSAAGDDRHRDQFDGDL